MVIAVNTRLWLDGTRQEDGYFMEEVCNRMVAEHTGHRFYFLFDRPLPSTVKLPPGATPVVVGPPARYPLLWKYWYDVALPRALKKLGADVLVSLDGMASLTTKVPQCLVVQGFPFLHSGEGHPKNHLRYYKYYTPRFLKKANSIAAVSQFVKDEMLQQYKVPHQKISVVYSAASPIFKPLPWEEHAGIKEQYTEGKEYFIYTGAIHPDKNLLNLLKAFSKFKKWQRSGFKLVLAGPLHWKGDAFLELLKTYKYRNDVVLLNEVGEADKARLLGAAYALVYPSFYEGFGLPVLEAIQCEVPVLTSADSAMQEIAGEAALYFNPHDVDSMAQQLMTIYKDEDKRSRLIEKGKELENRYSWQKTADALWQTIEAAKG